MSPLSVHFFISLTLSLFLSLCLSSSLCPIHFHFLLFSLSVSTNLYAEELERQGGHHRDDLLTKQEAVAHRRTAVTKAWNPEDVLLGHYDCVSTIGKSTSLQVIL